MRSLPVPGDKANAVISVTEAMCPSFDGVQVHAVMATWELARLIEAAARRVLEPHLDAETEGIGTHLSIDHLAPALVGESVRAVAVATTVEETRLVCDVSVSTYDDRPDAPPTRLIATGRQEQRMLPRTVLAKRFAAAAAVLKTTSPKPIEPDHHE